MINKKVLFFMPSIEGGGVEKNLFIVSKFFTKKFRYISLITTSVNFKSKFDKKIKIISPKSDLWVKFQRRPKYIICLFLLLTEIFKNKKIIVFSWQANIYCLLLCKLFGVKVVVRSNSAPIGWSNNILKNYIFKKVLKLADKTMVNSEEFNRELRRRYNIKPVTIYNPLNKNEIIKLANKKIKEPFFKKDCLNLINVARFTNQKDHLTLLKAINLIKNKVRLKLMIIGRGSNLHIMKNYISNNDLNDTIKIKKFTDNPFPYMRLANAFILSSTFEGLPNVLLESLVLKRFIISSNCQTGPREILLNGKGGLLFKVGNHTQLSKKILFLSRNKKQCNKMLSVAIKNLNRFDESLNLDKYFNLINNI